MQVRFLQIVPYSYYFCKDCDCRTLDYRYRLCHDDFKGQGPFCTSPLLISFPLCYWGGVKKIKKENENNTAKGNNTWNRILIIWDSYVVIYILKIVAVDFNLGTTSNILFLGNLLFSYTKILSACFFWRQYLLKCRCPVFEIVS